MNKHIVFTWELGQNYGHILKIMTIAKPLLDRGYQVSFVLRELFHVQHLKIDSRINIYQAPVWPNVSIKDFMVKNYSDLLIGVGYHNASHLAGILNAWVSILELLKPDLVICDHAPTAILATKIKQINTVSFGTGFEVPEYQAPYASLRPWDKISLDQLKAADQQLLAKINESLVQLGYQQQSNLGQLLSANNNLLCSLPEIDPYMGRNKTPYWGPMMQLDSGVSPKWPSTAGLKVFMYLRADMTFMPNVLTALQNLKCSTVVHFIGGAMPNIKGLEQVDNISISTQPLNMRETMSEASLVICHGGHGTVANALLSGVPMMLLPTQQEQKITAIKMVKLGIALELNGKETVMQMKKGIRAFVNKKHYQQNAQIIADKYKDFDLQDQAENLVNYCEGLFKNE